MIFRARNVILRSGKPYFMLRVPKDLIDKFGTQFIKKALHTTDHEEVKLLAENLTTKAKNTFAMLRSGILSEEQEQELIVQFRAQKKTLPEAKPRLLSNLFNLYFTEHSPNWTAKTAGEFRAQFDVMLECFKSRPIEDYDRSLCLACRTKLMRKLEPRTVNKYMSLLSSVFRWGVRHDYAVRNPAEGMMLDIDRRADQERRAYDLEDIQRIDKTLPRNPDEVFKRWIPYIAMYSGMRREEICQLHVADVRKVDGVWCFDINDSGDKNVKTESSVRFVPVHSQLAARGFLQFVENRKKEVGMHSNLWGFTPWKGIWGKKFGNWYSLYYNRRHVTTDPLKSFHSLRHTVADMLKQKGFQEVLIAELLGHTNASITTGRYGKRFLTPKLVDAVEALAYGIEI